MEEDRSPQPTQNAKKRRKHGRLSDVKKRMMVQTHETGEDCGCTRLKCFESVNETDRCAIIKQFNALPDRDAQRMYVSGLIEVKLVQRRRPRKSHSEALLHDHTYAYKVRVKNDNTMREIPVCYKAFLALHGISPRTVQTIQKQLKECGRVVSDGRGKHKNRPHALTHDTRNKIHEHIQSLQGRQSHYSLKKTSRTYLPEELNGKKLHQMYMDKYPNNPVSYETYMRIFNAEYNISFGYPRSDTCSRCDTMNAKEVQIQEELACLEKNKNDPDLKQQLDKKLRSLKADKELHLRRAQTFYDKKRLCKQRCAKYKEEEAIAMDFQRNVPVPNIASNMVYYKRQLTVHLFNIHVLASGESIFYCYDETVAKKGADEVVSMLHHFVFHVLSPDVKKLYIFCDSCAGQNKNFTVFRYIHYIVTVCKRLERVTMTFPERGHSYLECDKNMGLISRTAHTEVPKDWYDVIRHSRLKPSPFQVVECDQSMFLEWTSFFSSKGLYKRRLPVPSRPLKEVKVENYQPRIMSLRSGSYNSLWDTVVITEAQKKSSSLPEQEFFLPSPAYWKNLPIPLLKWKDLQVCLLHIS